MGQGTLERIDSELFLRGEAGDDQVTIYSDGLPGPADVSLTKNTVQHTLELDKLSRITNALEFDDITLPENQLIADALRPQAVEFARLAAGVDIDHLFDVAQQAVSDIGGAMQTTLEGTLAAFEQSLAALIKDRQVTLRAGILGQLADYFDARSLKEQAQGQYAPIAAQEDEAAKIIDFINSILSIFGAGITVEQLVDNPNAGGGSLLSEFRKELTELVNLERQAEKLQKEIEAQSKRQAGAEALLQTYFTGSELNVYFANAQSSHPATAADALIDGDATAQAALKAIETGISAAASPAATALGSTITRLQLLAAADSGSLKTAVQDVQNALTHLKAALEAPTDASNEWDHWVRAERLDLVKDVLLPAERAVLTQVLALLEAIPGDAAIAIPAAFLAAPDWPGALVLFDNPEFGRVIEAYKKAQDLAENFDNYKAPAYADFQAVHRNIVKFEIFKQYLASGFDFGQFKADYLANVAQLDASVDLLEKLALEARYLAQIASLEDDRSRIDVVVNHNDAVVGFFESQKTQAENDFNTLDANLAAAYRVTINLFVTSFTIQLDYSNDARYKKALLEKNTTAANYLRALGLSQSARQDQTAADNQLADIRNKLAALNIEADRAALVSLKETLAQQYRFLRSLSSVTVKILSETRAGQAAAEFDDKSSLIAEVQHYRNNYAVTPQPGVVSSVETFLPGPSGNSVIKHVEQADFFEVLSLGGLNAAGVHADYASVESLTLMTGEGADQIRVHDSLGQAASDVFLLTGAGDDRIILSNADQSLDDLVGNVHVDAQGGTHNLLVVDDAGDPDADSQVVISRSSITGLAPGAITYEATGGWFASRYDDPSRTFAGGVTIAGGSGGNTITIASTRNDPTVIEVTTVKTGDGHDNVDIVEADQRYLVVQGQSGDDFIDATATTSGVAVFGGPGIDEIRGGFGPDVLAGGYGEDRIFGQAGHDVILGDRAVIRRDAGYAVERIETAAEDLGGVDDLVGGQGDDVILGGAGADTLRGDAEPVVTAGAAALADIPDSSTGTDIILGDNGVVVRRDGSGEINDVYSLSSHVGGADIITGGAGDNIIIGGARQDRITGGPGNEIILGDSGRVFRNENGVVTRVATIDDATGGSDTISGGDGADVILGGAAGDEITASLGGDIILGDAGVANIDGDVFTTSPTVGGDDRITGGLAAGAANRSSIIGGAGSDVLAGGNGDNVLLGDGGRVIRQEGVVEQVRTIDPAAGGRDTITSGSGSDIILGGAADDVITAGEGSVLILGDNGEVNLNRPDANDIFTIDPDIGGDDTISGGSGTSIMAGGFGADRITTGTGEAVILGDNGMVQRDGAEVVRQVRTTDDIAATGGADNITSQAGTNIILGGVGDDMIQALAGDNIILGDNGQVDLNNPGANDIFTTSPALGGIDIITGGGDSRNIIIGGAMGDKISGGIGNDTILGDGGRVSRDAAGAVTKVATIDDAVGGSDAISGGDGADVILGGAAGDEITASLGGDIILGDAGVADLIGDVFTTSPTVGGDDRITGGLATGAANRSIIIGGAGSDVLSGGNGDNVLVGDGGRVIRQEGVVEQVRTIDPATGGSDAITSGSGSDIILGGAADDVITAGEGSVLILGDNGEINLNRPDANNIFTINPDIGGDDTISGGSGTSIMLGGFGADRITTGTGEAVILGDNGAVRRDGAEVVTRVETTDLGAESGGADQITSLGGRNVILGGVAGDIIEAPGGNNIILGDNGQVNLNSSANDVFTTTPDVGGADIITGGSGDNIIIGGARGDEILGGIGNDVILGDNGRVARDAANTVTRIETADPGSGSDDTITGGGDDIIVGSTGRDRIEGGFGDDILIGDHAALTFNSAPIVTLAFTGPADGNGDDYFRFEDGWGDDLIYEAVIPGSWDTLDFAAVTTEVTVHFASDTIRIADHANSALSIGIDIEQILTGSGDDTFIFDDGAGIQGRIDADSGYDTFNWSSYTTPLTVNRATRTATGVGVYANVENVVGGRHFDHLIGADVDSVWHLSDDNGGDIDSPAEFQFASFENLTGGDADDTYVFAEGVQISGVITGDSGEDPNSGNDTLDYAAYTTDVRVDLALGLATGVNRGWALDIQDFENANIRGIENVIGGTGQDTLLGDERRNILRGNAGNDTLDGRSGDDFLDGGPGSDEIAGGTGDDRFIMVPGSTDAVIETAGHDTLDFSGAMLGVRVDIGRDHGQTQTVDDAGNRLRIWGEIENLIGSQLPDVIDGNDAANILQGLGGADRIRGRRGDDRIDGGEGDDQLYGDDGRDRIFGDAGNDTIRGGHGDDELYGGRGEDHLSGDHGNDRLAGGAGADHIAGGRGEDLLYFPDATEGVTVQITNWGSGWSTDGLGGTDELHSGIEGAMGTAFNDTLIGDDDANRFFGQDGDDWIEGRGGADLLEGGPGSDTILGGRGDDWIAGGAGRDMIDAGRDDDTVVWLAGEGDDSIDLDSGWDRLRLTATDSDDEVHLTSPAPDQVLVEGTRSEAWRLLVTQGDIIEIDTAAGHDLVQVGDLAGTDVDAVVLHLGAGDDVVAGAAATETIKAYGGAGSDRFSGGADDDYFDGGPGSDWVDYSAAPQRVKVDLKYKAFEDGHGQWDYLDQIENIIATPYNDYIGGTNDANRILALAGDDHVWARRGDDRVDGGEGDDELRGDEGRDTIMGGEGSDKIYGGHGEDAVYGEAGDDYLRGENDDDTLHGGSGDDSLYGDHGDDLLAGGGGVDQIEGGRGEDLLYFPDAVEGITVQITHGGSGWSSDGLGGTDELRAGIEGAMGTAFNDTLIGDDGANRFFGQGGDDWIEGRGGDDLLDGGAGHDWVDAGSGDDTVTTGTGHDMIFGGPGNDLIIRQNTSGKSRVDAGSGDRDTVRVMTGDADDQLAIYPTADYATTLGRVDRDDFEVSMENTERVELLTGAGRDTVRVFGLWFPGIEELAVDLGEGDDTFIGSQPDQPIGKTRITAFGGAGDDEIIGGPTRELFVRDYQYPTPPPVVAVEPVAYWNLNETGGSAVADSAGESRDGKFFARRPDLDDAGPPASVAAFGAETGADFHGTTQEYIAVAHNQAFETANGTVQLWFKTRDNQGDQALFSKDHAGYVNGGHLNIRLDHAHIEVRLQGENASHTIRTGHIVHANTWYHLAFSFGQDGMQLYLNGELAGTNEFTGGMAANQEAIVIGGSNRGNRNDSGELSRLSISDPFNGYIDEVAFYGQALGTDQIRQLIKNGPRGVVTGGPDSISGSTATLPPARQPLIDWLGNFDSFRFAGAANGRGLSETRDWLSDFVDNLGQNESERNPNAGIELKVPLT